MNPAELQALAEADAQAADEAEQRGILTAPPEAAIERQNGETGPAPTEPSSWAPVDLTSALAGDDLPPPELLRRSDGIPLLYRGKTHSVQAETESGKTWLANIAATEVLEAGGNVLWLDFEDDARTVVARLRALGIQPDTIAQHFTYVRPEEPLQDRHGRVTHGGVDFSRLLAGSTFVLAVIDGVTEAMVTEGLELVDNADVAAFIRRVPRRIAETGAAVLALDHVTKSRDGRSRYAIGGQHKLAGITGAAYTLEVIRPFSRATGAEPVRGLVNVRIAKDRVGWVRARALDDRLAILELTSWPDGGVTASLSPPDTTPTPDIELCHRIVEYLQLYEGAAQSKIEKDVAGHSTSIRDAIRWMAADERAWIRVEKSGNAHRHYLTDEGAEEFADDAEE